MTDAELRDQALAKLAQMMIELKSTTDSYPRYLQRHTQPGHWTNAFQLEAEVVALLQQIGAAPSPPPLPPPQPIPVPLPNPVPPPAAGVYFGAYIEGRSTYNHYYPNERTWDNVPWDLVTWDRFEQNAGKKIAMLLTGTGYIWQGSFGDLDFILASNAKVGTIPVLDVDTTELGTLADIAAGKHDAQIDAAAEHFKSFGKPCVVRIDAEMNGSWYSAGKEIRASSHGPADFISMWRLFVTRFRNAGATNVSWHFCPNVDPDGIQFPFEQLYPGDACVDWSGMTGYAHAASETASWVFGSTYDRLVALAPTKPIMIGEMGSVDLSPNAGAKVRFIQDFFAHLPSWPQIKAFCWFNWYILENGVNWDWPIESSPQAQAAFKTAVAHPLILGRA